MPNFTKRTPVFQGGGNERAGRSAPAPRQYQVQHLWENHHRMLRLALLGWKTTDIAKEMGVHHVTVANIINSALGQKVLQEMRGAANKEAVDTATRIREMNEKALSVLEEILDDADAPRSLRAKVAMDNLSRAGFAPQINVKGTFDHRHLTGDDIARIREQALQAAARQGCLVLEDAGGEATRDAQPPEDIVEALFVEA